MRAFNIQLPDELAEMIDSKVASGDFQSPSALLAESLVDWFASDTLLPSDHIPDWMVDRIRLSLAEYERDPSTAISAEQAFANILDRHAAHKNKAA
jgi:antitoxin ParD1/3/4